MHTRLNEHGGWKQKEEEGSTGTEYGEELPMTSCDGSLHRETSETSRSKGKQNPDDAWR